MLPLTFQSAKDYERIKQGDVLRLRHFRKQIRAWTEIEVDNAGKKRKFRTERALSGRQIEILLAGGLIDWMKRRLKKKRRR